MKLNDVLKWIIWVGIFATPFIPFVVAGSMFFPFIVGKAFLFRIIVGVIFFAWFILAFREKDFRPQRSYLLLSLFGFLGVMAIATILSENSSKSFWSNFERMEGYVTLIHLAMYFLIASSFLKTQKVWAYLLHTTLGASAIMTGYAFSQLFGWIKINQGGVRVDATLGNATYLAVYILVHIFLATFALVRFRKTYSKAYSGVIGLLLLAQLITLYFTATRGAILGLLAGSVLSAIIIAIFEKQNLFGKKVAIGFVVAVVVLIIGFFAIKNTALVSNSPVLGRFSSISLEETTTKSRFMIWGMALQGFKERPIFGWGQESFNYVFNKYYNPNMYGQEQWFDRTHNVVLDWLIAGGFLGLLGYLLLFVLAIYYIWKIQDFSIIEKAVFTGMLGAYFFHNLFVFDNLVSYIIFFSILAFLHFKNASGGISQKICSLEFSENTKNIIVPVSVSVVGLIFLAYFNWAPFMSNKALIGAMQPKKSDANLIINNFQNAIGYNSLGTAEIREQLTTFSLSVAANEQVSQDVKKLFVDYAGNQLLAQVEVTPNDARYQFFTGLFFSRLGLYDEAIKYLEKAIELSPKKQGILLEMGAAYMGKGDKDKMISYFKQAYELAPTYEEAGIQYGVALVIAEDLKEADNILSGLSLSTYLSEERIMRAYNATAQYNKILEIWKKRVELTPKDVQSYFSLSATYLKLGNKAEAVKTLEKVLTFSPELKIQIDQYIRDIWAGKNLIKE